MSGHKKDDGRATHVTKQASDVTEGQGTKVRKCSPLPHIEALRQNLEYCPETGVITWLIKTNTREVGAEAGHINQGYRKIGLNGTKYTAHRIAWKLMTGGTPPDVIDHINGDGTDNRWANLRAATRRENARNCKTHSDKAIPFKGVARINRSKGYNARIMVDGRSVYLGSYKTPEEANAEYQKAAARYFGEFSNDGSTSSLPQIPSIDARVKELETALESLRAYSGRVYCKYLDQMREDKCLGVEAKIAAHTFSREHLDAHNRAYELLGTHRGLATAIATMDAALSQGSPEQ